MTDEYFPKRNNVKCGFESHCKECHKEKEKTRIRVVPFNENGELYCLKCKTYKPLSEFYPNSSNTKNRNYYSSYCKSCESERSKIKRENYYSDDPILFFRDLATACRGRAYRSNKFECTITKEDLLDIITKFNMSARYDDYKKEFKDIIIKDFIDNYLSGKTPNPCIKCNKHFKFGELWTKAKELNCEYIATGHYAKIEYSDKYENYVLKKLI